MSDLTVPQDFTVPQRVAIVGAGLMGHAIARVFLVAGCEVRVWDADSAALDAVTARIGATLEPGMPSVFGGLVVARELVDAVREADLVVEAIAESLPAKQKLVEELDVLAPQALIATNTSVLRISEIAATSRFPERVIGAHWWNPPYLIDVVEVTPGDETASSTVDTVVGWLTAVGKTPVRVNFDAPGFIGNRMQFALWREALSIVEEGICDAETVDLVARETFGRRLSAIGPIENADFIGLPLTSAIMSYVLPHLSNSDSVPAIVQRSIAAGRSGAASGAGILDWPDGARERTRQRLAEHLAAHREPRSD